MTEKHPQKRLNTLGIMVAAILALAAASVAFWAWASFSAVKMSVEGYVAMVLGGLATLGLGGGLMALLFYSHNKGFDEAAGGHLIEDKERHQPPS